MKGLLWGLFYNQHGKRTDLAPEKLKTEIQRLMGDEDVTSKSGIYEYLLTGQEKKLSICAFNRRDALVAHEKQGHKRAICSEEFEFEQIYVAIILCRGVKVARRRLIIVRCFSVSVI